MVKTQIQIPDDLYRRVKRLAEAQEWSLAETLRRGAELLLVTRPTPSEFRSSAWKLGPPAHTKLKRNPFADPDWREHANFSTAAMDLQS